MESMINFDQTTLTLLNTIAGEGTRNAARGFSIMVGKTIMVDEPRVSVVPLFDIPDLLGGLENDAIGIYLQVEDTAATQVMLVMPYQTALDLVDLLMGEAPGTTTSLGRLERSALGEVGNLTTSYFLNTIASMTGIDVRPSPPAVLVDMVGAIFDIVIATSGQLSDKVLLVQSGFRSEERQLETNFWVIPDANTLEAIFQGFNK